MPTFTSKTWWTAGALVAAAGTLGAAPLLGPDPECESSCEKQCEGAATELTSGAILELVPSLQPARRVVRLSDDDKVSRRVVMTQSTGDRTVTVKIDGDKTRVYVNDEEVPASRVHHDDDRIIVLNADGDEIARFNVAIAGAPLAQIHTLDGVHGLQLNELLGLQDQAGAPHTYTFRVAPNQRGNAAELWQLADGEGLLEIAPQLAWGGDDEEDEQVAIAAPPVMVGISMAEPSEGIRQHFGFDEGEAIQVIGVAEGLPAEQAGVKLHDLITAINGQSPASPSALYKTLSDMDPGDTLTLTLLRKGRERTVEVTVQAYDADRLSSMPRAAVAVEAPVAPPAPEAPGAFRWRSPDGTGAFVVPQIEIQGVDGARRELELQLRALVEEASRHRGDADRYKEEAQAIARRFADQAARQAQRFVVPQAPAALTPGLPMADDRMARLEERLARLEKSLDTILKKLEEQPRRAPGTR